MYNWTVTFATIEGIKTKKVKANSKPEAIKKASKNLSYYTLKECKLTK